MRRQAPFLWSAAALLLLAGPAEADDAACKTATSQMDLNICAGAAFQTADAALNRTYQTIVQRLGDDDKAKSLLATAERAWIALRDAQCDFEASSTIGGTVHPLIVLSCRTDMTRERTKALRRLLSCTEGDLSCPLPPR